ncbi:MAG: hypothetical protein IJR68_10725 [Fretibacterium sp.]|nr:hypothetical protein [Fretibacterium sp.]
MKDIDYYMSLPYALKVQELSEADGGGLLLSIPLLGEAAVNAHGATYLEAREKLERLKRDFLEIWIEANVNIPEPQDDIQGIANVIEEARKAKGWLEEARSRALQAAEA